MENKKNQNKTTLFQEKKKRGHDLFPLKGTPQGTKDTQGDVPYGLGCST